MLSPLFSLIAAQNESLLVECPLNPLVSDFDEYTPDQDALDVFNLAGGSFGIGNVTHEFTGDGTITITTTDRENFWFFTSDATPEEPCVDITPYSHLVFDVMVPTGADFTITFTAKGSDCIERLPDSVYVNASEYADGPFEDGVMRTITLPFKTVFATDVEGNDYDFVHHKDVTLVNIIDTENQENAVLEIKVDNIRWICEGNEVGDGHGDTPASDNAGDDVNDGANGDDQVADVAESTGDDGSTATAVAVGMLALASLW